MNYDIGDLLNGWAFKPDEFLARRIRTSKGEEKLQIRIDMGLLQLELDGRPDGQQPHGCPSLLDYYQDLIESRDTPESFVLEEEECEELFQEAWQYYHRYLSLFNLEDYEGVIADTEHTLQIFELVDQCAPNDEVRWYFEQYYPTRDYDADSGARHASPAKRRLFQRPCVPWKKASPTSRALSKNGNPS